MKSWGIYAMRRSLHRIVPIVALSLLFLLSAVPQSNAQTYWFGKNKIQYKDFQWKILKTPHFDIHFSEGYKGLAARTAVILEYGYDKLAIDFSHHVSWRVPVIIYGSHSDFQQTNITWDLIPEGVQAFAEPLRRRMVLHFPGSNTDYVHTAIHELVHIFTFDIVYHGLMQSAFSRTMLFNIPGWFAEGLAEYYSVGYNDEVEMFMRDATVFDYLYGLDEVGGYYTYKAGQAAVYYLSETYGPGKVLEIMDHLRHQHSMELALNSSLGVSTAELSREWKKFMRRKYWPLYTDKREPEYYGRRLTDHMKDHNYMNTKPVFSPDGEFILFFSDRGGFDAIYLINALSGKIERKLLTGHMTSRFESIRTMKSSLTFSPDGTKIAFVAEKGGRDKFFIMSVPKGRIVKEVDLALDFFYSPAWSPTGDKIALVGTQWGQTDIYLYHIETGEIEQVTNDVDDEENPDWFPDGVRIAYGRFSQSTLQPEFYADEDGLERIAGVDFRSQENVTSVNGDIWEVNIETGEKKLLLATEGSDNDPIVIADGKEIIFTSNENGFPNLYRGSLEVGSYHRFTDVLGGLFSPAYSKSKDRLTFSAFNTAGYDLFIMEGFSEKSKNSYSTGNTFENKGIAVGPVVGEASKYDRLALVRKAWDTSELTGTSTTDTLSQIPDTLAHPSHVGTLEEQKTGEEEEVVDLSGRVDLSRIGAEEPRDPREEGIPPGQRGEYPEFVIDEELEDGIDPDTLEAIRARERKKIGTIQPYSVKFSTDYIGNGMGVFFSSGFGFGLMNQIAFSDLLGNHHLYVAFNLYRSIEDSDLLVSYYYIKKRIDYAVGLFQVRNYLSSRVSSVGETFINYRYFTERNYGGYALVSVPFSTSTRMELELQSFVSERDFFDQLVEDADNPGELIIVPGERSTRKLFQPTLSFVHDSAYFGAFGPVVGSRWMASVSRAIPIGRGDVSRFSAYFDYRKYIPVFYRNYLAFRGIGAFSSDDDAQLFFLGGPLTMRGYDYLQFMGSRMLLFNIEYRYPLLDAIIFGWPGRWGFRNVGGTLFFDTGAVWGRDMYIEPIRGNIQPRTVNDIDFYSDFGMGFYLRFGYLVLNFQVSWPTDFRNTGKSFFHFYIGPMF